MGCIFVSLAFSKDAYANHLFIVDSDNSEDGEVGNWGREML